MKKVSRFTLIMLVASGVIDLIGFAFGLFYAGVFYDNLAHFITSFSLVALAAELYLRRSLASSDGASRTTVGRALAAGAIIGLVGGVAWESFETLLNLAFPETIAAASSAASRSGAQSVAGTALIHLRRVAASAPALRAA